MKRIFSHIITTVLLITTLLIGGQQAWSQKKGKKKSTGIEAVSAEKKRNEQNMRNTSAKLEAKKAEISRQLSRLSSLNSQIEENKRSLDSLTILSDSISRLAGATSDSVMILTEQVQNLRRAYVESLRRLQPYDRDRTTLSFIFSSKDFVTLQRRLRYLRQFSRWRRQRAEAITTVLDSLETQRKHLTTLEARSASLINMKSARQSQLDSHLHDAEHIVSNLKKDEKNLLAVLEKQKQQARELDRRLDKLIAEQQAAEARRAAEQKKNEKSSTTKSTTKPAAAQDNSKKNPTPSTKNNTAMADAGEAGKLTGSFAENKGRLPCPIAGKYRIISRFGRQPHPSIPKVEIDNSGIDIETSPGAAVRAIFDGRVSAIFKEDGYNSIVMIRHGSYITIYAGIDNVTVKSGDKVSSGQTLGKVNVDSSRGIPVLHFEIRNERTKLNPQQWLK